MSLACISKSKTPEEMEDYEEWLHEQQMDAEFGYLDGQIRKTEKIKTKMQDKKLVKTKQDVAQQQLLEQRIKEQQALKQKKIEENKIRRMKENARRQDRQVNEDKHEECMSEDQNKDMRYETEALIKENIKDDWEDWCD
jgi:hypothetical protein